MRAPLWKRSETWGFGLATLTLIVVTLFSLRAWTALQTARDEIAHTQVIEDAAAGILQTLLDAETGQRGFLLTGQAEYLEPYQKAVDEMPRRLSALDASLRGSDHTARAAQVRELVLRKLEELRGTIELGRSGGMQAAMPVVQSNRGKHTMDQARDAIVAIESAQRSFQTSRQADVDYYRERVPIYIGAGGTLLLVLLIGAFLAIRREADQRENAFLRADQSRREAEAARDLLSLTLRSIGDATIVADADGHITLLNHVAADVTGWGDAAVGRSVDEVFRIINEYTRQTVESPIDKVRRTGAVVGLANHTLLIRKDGREVPIDDSGAPIRGPNGELAGFVLVFRDITERKEAEEELRHSEERFRTLANTAPALLFLAGNDGAVSFFNRQWLDFTGRSEDSQIGSSWLNGVHGEDAERVRADYAKGIASGSPFQLKTRLRRHDGTWRSLLCTASPYRDASGAVTGYVGACFDITELLDAQRALEVSESRFRTLLAGTTAMVWQTDGGGSFATRMPDWEAFTGQRWPDYQGYGGIEVVHPEDRERVVAEWQKALASRDNYTTEFRLWNDRAQDWRHVITRGTPLKDASGGIVEWIGTLTDNTEQKRMEDRLRQAAKFESLGVLAGGIAHDFNNLLVGILGNASLLQASLRDPVDRDLALGVIQAGERAAVLTQQMLAYSGRGRFIIEKTEIAAEIQQLEPKLRAGVPAFVQLKFNITSTAGKVEIDRTQIEQLLTNLVANAGEAIDKSGGEVSIAVRQESVRDDASGFVFDERPEPGIYNVIEVRDTGHGMNAATRMRIFDPFFSTKFTGRGLGLAAVLGIVRGHRGGIRIESEPGRGTSFQVFLPSAAPAGVELAETAVAGVHGVTVAADARPTVLVVDDEEIVRSLAATALSRQGFRVLVAEDGLRGIETFQAEHSRISVVLLDLMMPAMSGHETLAALREIDPSVPVVATSGFNKVDALSQFGGDLEGFIQKPFSAQALTSAVRAVLD